MSVPIHEKCSQYEFATIVVPISSVDYSLKTNVTSIFSGSTSPMIGVTALRGSIKFKTSADMTMKYNAIVNQSIPVTAAETAGNLYYIEEDFAISDIFITCAAGCTINILLKYI